jgi:FMN phosphatase YigB (HAD superfamily)
MTGPLVVLDLGDVLVRTAPGAQYAALAQLTGVLPHRWAAAADATGLTEALERGRITFADFADEVCWRAGATAAVPLQEIREAFCRVVVGLDEEMTAAVAPLAAQGRLLLASNTSEPHWHRIRRLLADTGVTVPACLSYEIGHRKPDDSFFQALAALDDRVKSGAVFLDDRGENVAAARRHGLESRRHRDPRISAAWLTTLAHTGDTSVRS